MKLNEKQTHALEEIYRVARMYTKIAAELNKVADTIELESEKNDEEFMKVFGVSQGYYMNDIVRVFDNLPESLPAHRAACTVDKEIVRSLSAKQVVSRMLQILLQRCFRRTSKWDRPLPLPVATDQKSNVHIDIFHLDPYKL